LFQSKAAPYLVEEESTELLAVFEDSLDLFVVGCIIWSGLKDIIEVLPVVHLERWSDHGATDKRSDFNKRVFLKQSTACVEKKAESLQ